MKIGILSQNKEKNITGINRVTLGTLTELLKLDQENQYSFIGRTDWFSLPLDSIPFVPATDRVLSLNYLLKANPLDIIHSHYRPFHVGSRIPCGKILTIHDLIPLLFPEWYGSQYDYYNEAIRQGAAEADLIIAVSEYTKRDIVEYYGIPEEKIKVVYNGLFPPKLFAETAVGEAVAGLEREDFLLSVSGVGPHKNQTGLVEGFLRYRQHHPDSNLKLVLTGPVRRYEVIREILEKHKDAEKYIVFTGFVTDAQLVWLYRRAIAFLYVSFYEGFGLPILEALSVGKAVICSDTTSMPEVGGNAVEYCNPHDADSIEAAITHVINDVEYRCGLEALASKQAALFSYERAAHETLDIYRRFLK